MKVFLDTNVLISAFTARGLCADLFRYVIAEHEILTGEVNLLELRRILATHFHASEAQMVLAENLLKDQTIVSRPAQPSAVPMRNPDDAWVLASAVVAAADLLVTGDKDLLSLGADAPIPILTPRAAWERLRQGE